MENPTRIEGSTGSEDENRITTLVIPYYVKTFEEIASVGRDPYKGMIAVNRSFQAWNDGTDGWVVNVQYRGYANGAEAAEAATLSQSRQSSGRLISISRRSR